MTMKALGLVLGLVLAAATAHAAGNTTKGNAAKGKVKFYTCLGCHGVKDETSTYPTYRFPKLAGQHAQYIVDALKEYKSGARSYPTMHAQAASLGKQDMQDIAAYLSSLGKAKKGAQHATKHTPTLKLAARCAACHGAHGISTSAQFPILAGQYPDYLTRALHEYQSGARTNPIMKNMAAPLSDRDIYELAHYFASQPSPLHTPPRP